jgi:folate-binding protein YgfZ
MMATAGLAERRLFDFSSRVKLRVTGADCVRFLNGQITNDIRKATGTVGVEACVLSAKGKLEAHLFVHQDGECFLIDADPALQSVLQPRLERYLIADDVNIEDVSSQFAILHVVGLEPDVSGACKILSVDRFGVAGFDIWCPATEHDQIIATLSRDYRVCDLDCAERLRVKQGIPAWGRELTPEIIPVEANLERRCIDYEKGCYIGQETISRMKMSGQRNKQLCGLISMNGVQLTADARLIGEPEGKDAGWISSTAAIDGRNVGLGYVKRGFTGAGTQLHAAGGGERVPVQVVELPFSD